MVVDKAFLNVLILSWGFMFTFSAFITTSNIQKTVLDSIEIEDSKFTGDGYISLAIVYAVLSICTFFTPSYAEAISPRLSIFAGSLCYGLFVATFLWPEKTLLYFASALQGLGASLMWVGHGRYITQNSNADTMSSNSGIFWAIYQVSFVIGNFAVYCIFTSKTYDRSTRRLIFIILTILAIIGTLILATLRKPPAKSLIAEEMCERENEPMRIRNPALIVAWTRMRRAYQIIVTPNMMMLTLTFIYSGIVLAFYSGVYTSSFGFTVRMGESRKKLVSLVGIFLGIGEVTAGMIFGPLASKLKIRSRSMVLVIGSVMHGFCYLTILLNLPDNSPFTETKDIGFVPPSIALAMIGALALGFGDACLNTQIIALLGTIYTNDAESVFSLYLFFQSIAVTISFFYSNYFGLYLHLGILAVLGIFGTISFVAVDLKCRKIVKESMISDGIDNIALDVTVELENIKR